MKFTCSTLLFFLSTLLASTLALPFNDVAGRDDKTLLTRNRRMESQTITARDAFDHFELAQRQLIGEIFKGIGEALVKIPGKIGKKIGKEQSKNVGSTNGVDVNATADRMAKNFEKQGKPQNMDCLRKMVTHMAEYGGSNGNWPCNLPSAAKAAENKKMDDAKKKAFGGTNKVDPKSVGAMMSAARKKAMGKRRIINDY